MAETTTIKITREAKKGLDRYREHPNESYDQVIRKLTYISENVRKEPKLSQETMRQIDEARQRMAKGEFIMLDELAERLGIEVSYKSQPGDRERALRSAQRIARAHTQKARARG